ncbi:hypothetical protein GCM10010149_47740 [Nonomuraea roseoviolacea subsp. roseoviolacea]|uniref:DUF2637 domain-containing protein n=1 Tax=Nonomuraea roseoviolacea TaxID=103837 RepID=UPI0031D565E7
MNVDRIIRYAAYVGVSVLAGIAAVVSYNHAYEVARAYGESGEVARLVPLVIDGLLVVASVVQLDAARNGRRAGWLAWLALIVGIALTLGANVLHGIAHGPVGAVIAALPAVTLTIAFELLMHMIRRAAVEATPAVEELPEPEPAPAPEVEGPAGEAPKPRKPRGPRRGTVGVAAHHVEAVKAYLATLDDVSGVTGESLASVLPNLVVRTRREALKRAKAEMGLDGAQKPVDATADMLPGLTASTV